MDRMERGMGTEEEGEAVWCGERTSKRCFLSLASWCQPRRAAGRRKFLTASGKTQIHRAKPSTSTGWEAHVTSAEEVIVRQTSTSLPGEGQGRGAGLGREPESELRCLVGVGVGAGIGGYSQVLGKGWA